MVPLLTRVVCEHLGGPWPIVLPAIRQPRSTLVKPRGLERAVALGTLKLRQVPGDVHPLVLVMLDADDDLPCVLAPRLVESMRRDDVDTACVLPNPEYETWFVAAAASLCEYLDVVSVPTDPETSRTKKGWIEHHFRQGRYSPPIDQPRLTARMDLAMCRAHSPSFDKLCRELGARLGAP